MTVPRIKVVTNADQLAEEAAKIVAEAADRAIRDKDVFSLVLSGGSTPRLLYSRLMREPYLMRLSWPKVQIYFGDERCVPPAHPDSNYRLADENLLSLVPIPHPNIHRIRGEIDPETAATEYGQLIKARFGDTGPDLILLGMGEDGHTASLFPQTAALIETKHRCVANYVPKLKAWRITLTAPFINRAFQVLILVSGSAKSKVIHEVLEGPRDPMRLPVQLIDPQGQLIWLLDAEAAGMI
jgi:6-phosphogluconolactonase